MPSAIFLRRSWVAAVLVGALSLAGGPREAGADSRAAAAQGARATAEAMDAAIKALEQQAPREVDKVEVDNAPPGEVDRIKKEIKDAGDTGAMIKEIDERIDKIIPRSEKGKIPGYAPGMNPPLETPISPFGAFGPQTIGELPGIPELYELRDKLENFSKAIDGLKKTRDIFAGIYQSLTGSRLDFALAPQPPGAPGTEVAGLPPASPGFLDTHNPALAAAGAQIFGAIDGEVRKRIPGLSPDPNRIPLPSNQSQPRSFPSGDLQVPPAPAAGNGGATSPPQNSFDQQSYRSPGGDSIFQNVNSNFVYEFSRDGGQTWTRGANGVNFAAMDVRASGFNGGGNVWEKLVFDTARGHYVPISQAINPGSPLPDYIGRVNGANGAGGGARSHFDVSSQVANIATFQRLFGDANGAAGAAMAGGIPTIGFNQDFLFSGTQINLNNVSIVGGPVSFFFSPAPGGVPSSGPLLTNNSFALGPGPDPNILGFSGPATPTPVSGTFTTPGGAPVANLNDTLMGTGTIGIFTP